MEWVTREYLSKLVELGIVDSIGYRLFEENQPQNEIKYTCGLEPYQIDQGILLIKGQQIFLYDNERNFFVEFFVENEIKKPRFGFSKATITSITPIKIALKQQTAQGIRKFKLSNSGKLQILKVEYVTPFSEVKYCCSAVNKNANNSLNLSFFVDQSNLTDLADRMGDMDVSAPYDFLCDAPFVKSFCQNLKQIYTNATVQVEAPKEQFVEDNVLRCSKEVGNIELSSLQKDWNF